MNILWLHANDNELTYNKKQYLLRASRHLGFDFVKDYKEHTTEPVDFVLNIEPYHFLRGNIWTGVWEIDLLLDRPEYDPEVWKMVPTIFVAIASAPEKLYPFIPKCHLLLHGVDTRLHTYDPSIKKKYDFVFSGSRGLDAYKERDRLITLLTDKGFSFKDYNNKNTPEDYIKKIHTARVQFVRSIGADEHTSEVAQRVFEGLALGPLLTYHAPELEMLHMHEGKDYFAYKHDQELEEKMTYLLNNPSFAKKMAQSGREKVFAYHTYEHRLIEILHIIRAYESLYCWNKRKSSSKAPESVEGA